MSNSEILDDFQSSNPVQENNLFIDDEMASNLSTAAKWGNILAIIGFVMVGIGVLVGLVMLVSIGAMASQGVPGMDGMMWIMWVVMIFYFAVIVLYVLPLLYLNRFASNMKTALGNLHQRHLALAFENLGRLYKFLGIFTLIMIGVYAVFYIVVIIAGASMANSLQGL
jgi:hypothetical protein